MSWKDFVDAWTEHNEFILFQGTANHLRNCFMSLKGRI